MNRFASCKAFYEHLYYAVLQDNPETQVTLHWLPGKEGMTASLRGQINQFWSYCAKTHHLTISDTPSS